MSIASAAHGYVFGISNDIPDNLFYVEENTILYPAGNNIILFNVEQKLQRFVPIGDQAEGITSIAVSSDRHVFAAAARSSPKPIINVYDLHTFRKRRQLTPIDNITSREFTSLSFSMDSKYLAAQCGKPEWTLHFYAWEKGKSIATISTSSVPEKAVNQISINPYDGTEICVVGQGFINIYRYSEGVLRPIHVNIPEQNFLCHCFVSIDRLVVGSEQGSLFLIKNGVFIQDLSFSNQSPVRCLQTMKQGFACGGGGGSVNVYEFKTPEKIDLLKQIPLPDAESIVTGMAATTVEGTLLAEINTNQVLKVNLSPSELSKNETLKFDSFTDTFHYGSIVGLDLCIRKPLLVTCSTDKSVRLWNYMTGTCEMVKHFGEDACSVAMHPSGLYILVGFVDKLRLMNILMDDLRPIREFSIRSCRECRFSNGGHVFAAAHGNIVQIFSTWNFDNIENLKGHNGKVKSLYWSPDDGTLVSAGSDGAVYSWKIKSMKREHEHILKSCVYNSAVCSPNGKIMYAVGSDKMIKEITESSVTKEFDAGSIQTQIAISNSGRMMFVGGSNGCIRSLRYPFGDHNDFQEHQAHSRPITKMRISYDDQYLFTCSDDGNLFIFKIADKDEQRGMKKERTAVFADEILITKSDLEEKNVLMTELQRNLDELKLEHEYQLRLKDMNFNEKLKELTEKFSQEIEGLKISTSVLRTEKEKEDVKYQEQLLNVRSRHVQELHEVEMKYNQQLMAEYDKYQLAQEKSTKLQDSWQKQMREFEGQTQQVLQEMQSVAEGKLNAKTTETQRLLDELRQQEKEFEEMNKQNQNDIDTEIQAVTTRYEKKLRVEREEGARLKGENGIMRKKFNTLNKDIEDNKAEIQRMKENTKKLETMADRDEHIQDKERKVYDLKKRNQELEKYKFVLDFRIKELKEQVEPRETHIAEMSKKIQEINNELNYLNKGKNDREQTIENFGKKLEQMKDDNVHEHRKSQKIMRYIKEFKYDLEEVMNHFQDVDVLKRMVKNFYEKYCRNETGLVATGIDSEVRKEYVRHHENLKESIQSLRKQAEQNATAFRNENVHNMTSNQELIIEINNLRQYTRNRKKGIDLVKVGSIGPDAHHSPVTLPKITPV